MYARSIIAIVAIIELLMPERVARFWVSLFCENPEDVELRPWVRQGIRLEGLALLAFVIWKSRDDLPVLNEPIDDATAYEFEEDSEPVEDVSTDTEVSLSPDTTRFAIASVLYHAEDPLAVSDIVSLAESTDWEVGRSTVSATLYRMYRDNLVDRREREDGRGYVYWLDEDGNAALEAVDAAIEPNPFQEAA